MELMQIFRIEQQFNFFRGMSPRRIVSDSSTTHTTHSRYNLCDQNIKINIKLMPARKNIHRKKTKSTFEYCFEFNSVVSHIFSAHTHDEMRVRAGGGCARAQETHKTGSLYIRD